MGVAYSGFEKTFASMVQQMDLMALSNQSNWE